MHSSARSKASTSGVTSTGGRTQKVLETGVGVGGSDDSSTSTQEPDFSELPGAVVDWSTLTILPDEGADGEATVLIDEDRAFEAMGFSAADEMVEQRST